VGWLMAHMPYSMSNLEVFVCAYCPQMSMRCHNRKWAFDEQEWSMGGD